MYEEVFCFSGHSYLEDQRLILHITKSDWKEIGGRHSLALFSFHAVIKNIASNAYFPHIVSLLDFILKP